MAYAQNQYNMQLENEQVTQYNWELLAQVSRNDFHVWQELGANERFQIVNSLKGSLYLLKRKIEQRQSLGRLYYMPSFINHSTTFDVYAPWESAARKEILQVYERYPILLNAAIQICDESHKDPIVKKLILGIIADSAVKEWPIEMTKPDSGTYYWDRQPLYLKKGAKACRKFTNYQIRFLALVESEQGGLSFRRDVFRAEAYFALGLGPHQVYVDDQKREKLLGAIFINQLGEDKPATKRCREACINETDYHRDSLEGVDAVFLKCRPDPESLDSKLWCQFGSEDSYKHFTIQLETASFASPQTGGMNKYQIYTEIKLVTQYGNLYLGQNGSDDPDCLTRPGIISLPFELTSNISTHAKTHYIKFAWGILTSYYQPNNIQPDNKGLKWGQVQPWIVGMIAAQCETYCRKMDDSETRSFRRMLLLNRFMTAAGLTEPPKRSDTWQKQRERLQVLEQEVFGHVLTDGVVADLNTYLQTIGKWLRYANLSENFLISQQDFNDRCWYVSWNATRFTRVEFNPCDWLLNAAEIVADTKKELHQEANLTLELFNQNYINLRPADSAYGITQLVTARMREFNQNPDEKNKRAPEPTLLVRIDEFELESLCIEYSGLPDDDASKANVSDPIFGRVQISKLPRYYAKDPRRANGICDTKDAKMVIGLKAFFMQGYPAKFSKIMKVNGDGHGNGIKMFIFPVEKMGDELALYKDRDEIEAFEDREVDPALGPFETPMDALASALAENMSFVRSQQNAQSVINTQQMKLMYAQTQPSPALNVLSPQSLHETGAREMAQYTPSFAYIPIPIAQPDYCTHTTMTANGHPRAHFSQFYHQPQQPYYRMTQNWPPGNYQYQMEQRPGPINVYPNPQFAPQTAPIQFSTQPHEQLGFTNAGFSYDDDENDMNGDGFAGILTQNRKRMAQNLDHQRR
ncbi:unnamed protein product, partial [Mesorhabditis spiculigera]